MKLWFKQKNYGWGWTPSSWEGWVVTMVYASAIVLGLQVFPKKSDFWFYFILLTVVLILVCFKKGEKPKWSWGKRN
jgi:Na+-translocating ferredoxin:NAD+ oxidoreductase RnfD subunit